MANIQFITDSRGQRISAVVPIELFEKLTRDSDIAELYEAIQSETGKPDNVRHPNEVINNLSEKGCTMQTAWRVYRGLKQKQVAEALGIRQSIVSEFERSERPRKDNLERLASLYKCSPEQLTLK